MCVHQVPAHSIPFQRKASSKRPGALISSAEVHSFSLFRKCVSFSLLFSLFPSLFHASIVLSLVVGSILCRARSDRTQITYRRFHFNIRSYKKKKKKEETCLVTDRNDECLRTTTIQLIQSFRARAPAVIPDFCISIVSVNNGREFRAWLVTSIVRVELFEKRPSILKTIRVFYRFR